MDLKQERVKVVTSSGNDGRSALYIDKVPALWGRARLIYVVGATTLYGQGSPVTQISRSTDLLWAPGDPFVCAGGPSGEQTQVGTSGASGLVKISLSVSIGLADGRVTQAAGLIAYFLPANVETDYFRTYIQQQYSRPLIPSGARPSGLRVIWNQGRALKPSEFFNSSSLLDSTLQRNSENDTIDAETA